MHPIPRDYSAMSVVHPIPRDNYNSAMSVVHPISSASGSALFFSPFACFGVNGRAFGVDDPPDAASAINA